MDDALRETVEVWGEERWEVLRQTSGEPPALLEAVMLWLSERIAANEAAEMSGSQLYTPRVLTLFHGARPPLIGVQEYIGRMWRYSGCSLACYLNAAVLLERFSARHPEVAVTSYCVHRLLVAAVLVSAKFLEDSYYNNAYYAKVGGIPTEELNQLEMELLWRLDFRLFVSPEELRAFCSRLTPPPPPLPQPLAPCMVRSASCTSLASLPDHGAAHAHNAHCAAEAASSAEAASPKPPAAAVHSPADHLSHA